MTEIAFDFTSAAVGTRSITAQISSPPVNATFTSTASPLSGIQSSINRFHTFSVFHSGSNEGAGQGYAYVQLTSDVPIRLTRVHFYTQSASPFHNQARRARDRSRGNEQFFGKCGAWNEVDSL